MEAAAQGFDVGSGRHERSREAATLCREQSAGLGKAGGGGARAVVVAVASKGTTQLNRLPQ